MRRRRSPRAFISLSTSRAIKGAGQFREPHGPRLRHYAYICAREERERERKQASARRVDYRGSYVLALPSCLIYSTTRALRIANNAKEISIFLIVTRTLFSQMVHRGVVSIRKTYKPCWPSNGCIGASDVLHPIVSKGCRK